ncbi:hypothetical protein [Streptomyces sp. NPDC058657]
MPGHGRRRGETLTTDAAVDAAVVAEQTQPTSLVQHPPPLRNS